MTRDEISWKGRQLIDPDRPYTAGEVAELFNVHPKTVARWADEGKIEYFKTLGGHRRFRVEVVINKFRQLGLRFPGDNRDH